MSLTLVMKKLQTIKLESHSLFDWQHLSSLDHLITAYSILEAELSYIKELSLS